MSQNVNRQLLNESVEGMVDEFESFLFYDLGLGGENPESPENTLTKDESQKLVDLLSSFLTTRGVTLVDAAEETEDEDESDEVEPEAESDDDAVEATVEGEEDESL